MNIIKLQIKMQKISACNEVQKKKIRREKKPTLNKIKIVILHVNNELPFTIPVILIDP